MYETTDDTRLFSELYDVHPQAIVWMRPIRGEDGMSVIDFEFAYINDEGLNYLNLTREQQRGLRLSVAPVLSEDLRRQVMQEMTEVYHTGKKIETNIYNPVLNKYARVLRTRLRDGVLTVVQDRTEENRTIRELEEKTMQLQTRETLLANLLRYSPAGISVTELIRDGEGNVVDGRTILSNDLGYEYFGIARDESGTRSISQVDSAMLQSPLYQMALETLRTGEPFHTQYFFGPAGRWLELSVARMDENHLINIFTDVTSIKEAQLKLEQAAERLGAVFNASQAGMFTVSPVRNAEGNVVDFRFVITNLTFSAYMGQPPEVLQGALGSTYLPDYLHNGMFDMYRHTYLTGETQRRDVHYHVDGQDLYLDVLSTKVSDEVLVTFTDYTALKKTQFQLEKLVDDLRRSNTSLEEFAHAASHDLKEPIRKIRTFTSRLESSLGPRLNTIEQNIFERMQHATERMTQLVDDLLSYSHLSLTPMEKEDVDLNNKMQMVLSDLEVQIEEKKAILDIGPLPVVKGYRRQLQQLFQNLVGNALKYSKPGVAPKIMVRAYEVRGGDTQLNLPVENQEKRYHLIEVRDNGIGFEQQYADRIFEMFKRLHGRSEYPGTGVGLSIARKVVENHQGYIWAESEPGKGASFKVLLPSV